MKKSKFTRRNIRTLGVDAMRNNFVSCKVWCRYKSVIDNKDPKTQELMRFMHQSPLSVSMH